MNTTKIDTDLLEKLYMSYGFEVKKADESLYYFIYTKSRYFGVDIILLSNDEETNRIAKEIQEKYSKIGFAVNLKEISSNADAEIELFKSFFSFESSIQRIKKKYEDFHRKQTRNLLGSPYEYIESPFELHNHTNDEAGIFEIIDKRLNSNKAELIIIEAAAGYGKTSTAYELLNIIATNSSCQTPIFTELSRSRGVKKFKYILLDEIDIEYPSLNSVLVTKEIKNGRIPLIIDGFDELLEKVSIDSTIDTSFEEVETMLDTIGNLLEFKAKIVLTTRKTAIFAGEDFETWIQKWDDKFNVTRIALKEPRLKDWLGDDKYSLIKEKDVPIQYLANPVILSFLKNLEFQLFTELIENPEKLVEQYFDRMLEREKERQNLRMTVEKQMEVFRNVVKMLLEFDCTTEEKGFFKDIILDTNKKLLEYTKTLYSSEDRHSIDSLVDSLATHALLDRKGSNQNQIGFINDFVLGTFIGQIIEATPEEKVETEYSPFMIELAVTSYRVQGRKVKSILWNKIQTNQTKFSNESVFAFDIYLKEALMRNYFELTIYEMSFYNIHFKEFSISSSVFLNCFFKNCTFEIELLQGVSFINCKFENCRVIGDTYIDGRNEITTIKCSQEDCSILIEKGLRIETENSSIVNDFEKEILKKLWNISNTKGHHIVKLSHCFEKNKRKSIYKSLQDLQEKGLLDTRGIHAYFVTNKIAVIKGILEIQNEL
jgi:hypothetical protein